MTPSQVLEEKGWLSLNQFVQYLKDEHPIKSLSYPAILRYVEKGVLEATKVGGQRRISKECIEHYVKYGVEVPYVPQTTLANNSGKGTQMSSSPTSSSDPSYPEKIIPEENLQPKTVLPGGLVIPDIPESRVKRPKVPNPPSDDDPSNVY